MRNIPVGEFIATVGVSIFFGGILIRLIVEFLIALVKNQLK